ncbi:glycosyltransferase family 25 protein [Jiella endophytica]|uniref:Glycosyltransferase family 25 protein n=1 Tax=Jiella endophytica TaxID=2558362 RepID=A0A4Y8RSY3_9HYPH|nr:glycosyltransferase family 25 protein [Jiella endophytica]TFF27405.1 glycosyltransferase family 25 protein [Jiella endophytica]
MERAIPEIAFINLDRAKERRALMEVQGERLGLGLARFPACEAAAIDEERFRRLATRWERPMTRPELAAFLSHRALWERAAQHPNGLIILEDDTIFSTHFVAAAEEVAASGFDLVNFETVGRRKFFRKGRTTDGGPFRFTGLAREKSGAGAYWLSQKGAARLLRTAETRTAPVDAYMFGVCRLAIAQVEPAATMQVHLLAERGFDVGTATETSIHQPRRKLPLTFGNLPFAMRRLGTQLTLAPVHLRRLAGVEFRPAAFDDEAFSAVLPVSRKALAAKLRSYEAQSAS